jgi:hypothetical protein
MFVAKSLAVLETTLSSVFSSRLPLRPAEHQVEFIRSPIGLFVVREDGANGSKLAQEIVKSFGYWNASTGHYFDLAFLGWGYDGPEPNGGPAYFELDWFMSAVRSLEQASTWRDNGMPQLIFTDFVFDVSTRQGRVDFERSIPLELTEALKKGKYEQIAPLFADILSRLKAGVAEGESPTFKVSDYLGFVQTRRTVWDVLVKRLGEIAEWGDRMRPLAVQDLRAKK